MTKEDRRRIVQLLQFAEPFEQQIKLFYDKRPEMADKKVFGFKLIRYICGLSLNP